MAQLTDEMKKKYIESSGIGCPFCNSHQIEGDSFQSDGKHVWQSVECLDCDKTWDDIYTLTDVEETYSI